MATERFEVERQIAASPAKMFALLCTSEGHVAIDSSGMLQSAEGGLVAGVGVGWRAARVVEGHAAAGQRMAELSFRAVISSQLRPSSSSTVSVCSPCSGARTGAPGCSSNCTGVATSGRASPAPTSTWAR